MFSMEVVSVGILHYSALFPGLFASLVSLGVTRLMGLEAEGWALLGTPELTPLSALQVGGLGIGCALVAILFCTAMHTTAKRYQSMFPNPYVRILVGGGAGHRPHTAWRAAGAYNGAGSAFISAAPGRRAGGPLGLPPQDRLHRPDPGGRVPGAARSSPPSSSAPPSAPPSPLCWGWTPPLGRPSASSPCSAGWSNCPLASILLSVELFGGGTVFFALACALELSPQRPVLPLQQPEDRLLQAGAPGTSTPAPGDIFRQHRTQKAGGDVRPWLSVSHSELLLKVVKGFILPGRPSCRRRASSGRPRSPCSTWPPARYRPSS